VALSFQMIQEEQYQIAIQVDNTELVGAFDLAFRCKIDE
jgi:hypothetical protein